MVRIFFMGQTVDVSNFNPQFDYPYSLRQLDFQVAMQDVYDFFSDVNSMLQARNLQRLDDMMRPANLSGTISDMVTDSLAKSARSLVPNRHHNGHPDLLLRGDYLDDSAASGTAGVEIKSTKKRGGQVDTHGARDQWMCVFVYSTDNQSQPVRRRAPLTFREVYLARVQLSDFTAHARKTETGTRTAALNEVALNTKLRPNWVYLDPDWPTVTHRVLRKRGDGVTG